MNEIVVSLFIEDLKRRHSKGISVDGYFTVLLGGVGNGQIKEFDEPNAVFFLIGDPIQVIVSNDTKKYEHPIDLSNQVQEYVFYGRVTIQNLINTTNTVKLLKISLL